MKKMIVDCVELGRQNMKPISLDSEKLHEYFGDSLTFIGTIPQLDLVAITSKSSVVNIQSEDSNEELKECNMHCKIFGFENTIANILLVGTTRDGNPKSICMNDVQEIINNKQFQEDVKTSSRFVKMDQK